MRLPLSAYASSIGGSFIPLCREEQIYGPETVRLYLTVFQFTTLQQQRIINNQKSQRAVKQVYRVVLVNLEFFPTRTNAHTLLCLWTAGLPPPVSSVFQPPAALS